MNRFERFYKIHDLLSSSRNPVPMCRFTEVLGASRNTITRDFDYLKVFFNAPIIYDRKRNGHCYDPSAPQFELPGLWLNPTELHALLACQQWLESVQPGVMGTRLSPLKQRIRQLLGDAGQNTEDVAQRIRVQPVYQRAVDDSVFMPVAEATLGRRRLTFDYHSRGKNETSRREVSPQQLLNYRNNWYLLAWCHVADALRLFSLDRLQTVTLLEQIAEEQKLETLERFAQESFGIFSGPALLKAHLRFSHESARWVAEETWHPDQRGEWRDDGYHLHLPYAEPTELIMDILRHGPEVEVLSPPVLREAVREKIRAMQKIY